MRCRSDALTDGERTKNDMAANKNKKVLDLLSLIERTIQNYSKDYIYTMSKRDKERAIKVKFTDGKTAYLLNKKAPKRGIQNITPLGDYMLTAQGNPVYFVKGAVLYCENGEEIEII